MKKNFSALILLLALCLNHLPLLWALDSKPLIKIGIIVPLSAEMAIHGVEIEHAMNLALQEISPQSHYSYSLIFEDNQLDAIKSVSAAKKLIDLEKVDAIITLWPPTATVVIPLSEKAKIIHYTIAWDPALAKENKFVLSHQVMVDEIAHSTLRLLKAQNNSKIAFIHMEETGFNLGVKYIRDFASQEGIELVADEAFNPNETDFRSLVSKIKSKSPNAYLVWSVMPSIDALIRQIKSQVPKALITGYLDYAQDLSAIKGSQYISEMYAADNFAEKYKKNYNEAPISKGANAYDIMKLLVSAFENFPNQKASATELKKYLCNIRDFPGAVGNFSIDQYGNSSYSPVTRKISGSNPVLADP